MGNDLVVVLKYSQVNPSKDKTQGLISSDAQEIKCQQKVLRVIIFKEIEARLLAYGDK